MDAEHHTPKPDEQTTTALDGVMALRCLARPSIERAKARILRHRGCCAADVSTILVVGSIVYDTLVIGARAITLADLEPLVSARCTAAWAALRQGPPPGRVHVVLFSGEGATALVSEPLTPDTTPATNAPGGAS